MARRTKTHLLAWVLAAVSTAAAYNGAAPGPVSQPNVADDHASWLVRDLWQFEAGPSEPTVASPAAAESRQVLLVTAAADRPAGLDAEYVSWLQRDLWQFTATAASTEPTQPED